MKEWRNKCSGFADHFARSEITPLCLTPMFVLVILSLTIFKDDKKSIMCGNIHEFIKFTQVQNKLK